MNTIHVVLCDFDYTLADSSAGIIDCVNHALTETGNPPAHPDSIKRMIGTSLEETFGAFIDKDDKELIKQCKELFLGRVDKGMMVQKTVFLDGVIDTLELIYDNVYTLGIVSTKRRSTIEEILYLHDLDDLFEVVIGYEDVAQLKPHPEAIQTALTHLTSDPSETVYVGDHPYDIAAARAAKTLSFAVASGPTPREKLQEAGPDRLLDRFSELQKVLNLL